MPLITLVWHAIYTVLNLSPQYLLFVCYTANLLVGIGVIFGVRYLIGIGFFWTLTALPLYVCYMFCTSDITPSGIAFHLCGVYIGLVALRQYRMQRYTWLAAISMGYFWQLLARWFTDPEPNINAAFRVYQGWEKMFSDYTVYNTIMISGFALVFIIIQVIGNKYFCNEEKT